MDGNLKTAILGYLAEHPDLTTAEIARGIGADEWDVQHAVCYMVNDGILRQVGKRELENGRTRPIYRVVEHED